MRPCFRAASHLGAIRSEACSRSASRFNSSSPRRGRPSTAPGDATCSPKPEGRRRKRTGGLGESPNFKPPGRGETVNQAQRMGGFAIVHRRDRSRPPPSGGLSLRARRPTPGSASPAPGAVDCRPHPGAFAPAPNREMRPCFRAAFSGASQRCRARLAIH
jgi:hypothetical protein